MIKNSSLLNKFENNYIKQRQHSYVQRLKIYESLLEEAIALKKLPLKNPLEEIDACLRMARILNSLK